MNFNELNLIDPILTALQEQGYTEPTGIQAEAIPKILSGRDLLGCAQTGTGKTAAFAVPTLQLLSQTDSNGGGKKIRSLVITPTRELAMQIYESFCTYGKHLRLRSCVIFGGVSQKPQETELRRGVDILVATPGRLNDLINQRLVDLGNVEILVLDEADRMLDMGFLNDVKKIIAKIPTKRQTLLFSATMPPDIARMADTILRNPEKVAITPVSSTVDAIEQRLYFVDKDNKKELLTWLLLDKSISSALVFTRTKHRADHVTKHLSHAGIPTQAIHGDKSQGARQLALSNFKAGKVRVLVATDIAARGIDIDDLSHVFNYELPEIPETYVHRIGRTGRAGLSGIAISFCDFNEKPLLADIEKLIGKRVPVVQNHPYPMVDFTPAEKKVSQPRPSRQASQSHSGRQTTQTGAKPAAQSRFGRQTTQTGAKPAAQSRSGRQTTQTGARPAAPQSRSARPSAGSSKPTTQRKKATKW
ncbi:MAG: DEAD/DEAH box helicase [Angelakisella sp.]